MELTYTDASRNDLSILDNVTFGVAYGFEDNDWEVTLPADGPHLANKSLVYIIGTEYGGEVREKNPHWDDSSDSAKVTYTGPSWHGMLERRVISPPSGQDHFHVSGEANAAIGTLVAALGLGGLFSASGDDSGISVSHDFRYVAGYTGIKSMLAERDAKLKISFDGSKVILWAEPIHDYSQDEEFDSDLVHLDITVDSNPVNHLVCLGSGEMDERIRIDLYADVDGAVSQTQTIFGDDLHEETYEYTSADEATLLENGTEKLTDMQSEASSFSVDIDPSIAMFDVGDIVGGRDNQVGAFVTAEVTWVSATCDKAGVVVEYKAGEAKKTAEETAADTVSAQSLAAINKAIAAAKQAIAAQHAAAAKVQQHTGDDFPDPPYSQGDIYIGPDGAVWRAKAGRSA